MKLTLDLENLENILEEALNKNMDNAIDSAIKQTVAEQIEDKVKSLIEEGVSNKIASYIDDYIVNTKIKIGGGYFDKTPEEELTLEEYIKRQISDVMNNNAFKITKKDSWGDNKTVTLTYEEYINSKFDITSEVEKALSNFMEKVKKDVNNKIRQQFDDVTRQMLSDTMLQLLVDNEAFTKIQNNIACIATRD